MADSGARKSKKAQAAAPKLPDAVADIKDNVFVDSRRASHVRQRLSRARDGDGDGGG